MHGNDRSAAFRRLAHNRYWWYRLKDTDYIPPVFSSLLDHEWSIMQEWFEDTELKFPSPGEVSIPGISFLQGLIGGNGVSSMVQCGHYVGYSTLLLGFLFRRMGKRNALFSIDIDASVTDYTQGWIDRAELGDYVTLAVGSSSEPTMVHKAAAYCGTEPQLVFIDSSHQYEHTLAELDLWWPALRPGGILLMHDVSIFAQSFDATGQGGVLPAVRVWAERQNQTCVFLNSFVNEGDDPNRLTYKDGCGIGIVQKAI